MTPEQAFSLANLVAVAAWVVLVIVGRSRRGMMAVTAVVIPSLALVYAGLLLTHWGETEGGFGSLAQVRALFANPWALLAGWIHYLAFDLFVGAWEIRDSAERGISHYLVIPCLALTFLFGPIGLLLYLEVRQFKREGSGRHGGQGNRPAPGEIARNRSGRGGVCYGRITEIARNGSGGLAPDLSDDAGGGQGGMAAQDHFDLRSEPAQLVAGGAGGVTAKRDVGEGVGLIDEDLYVSTVASAPEPHNRNQNVAAWRV